MRIILSLCFLLLAQQVFSQIVSAKPPDTNPKIIKSGKRINNLKEGLWIEYYNPEHRYVSSVVDTLFKSKGYYKNDKKVGEWEYYGFPRIIGEVKKLPYDFTPNIDSIVFYNYNERVHVDIFNLNNFLKESIEITDSLEITYHYIDETLKWGEYDLFDISDPHNLRSIIKNYKGRNLIIEKYFSQGFELNEMFTNDNERNELLKVWYRGTGKLSFERTSLQENYDKIIYYIDGSVFCIEKYKNYKLWNIACFKKNGDKLDCGSFTNGNGILIYYNRESNEETGELRYLNGEIQQ